MIFDLIKIPHLEEGYLLWREETPFAATNVFLRQTGERHTIEVDDLIPYFLEDSAYDAVLTGVDLQTDMLTVAFRKLQGIGDDTLVVQYDTGANDRLIYLVQLLVKRDGIDLLLVKLRMGQFGCQVSVVGEQQHTRRVTVQTTYRIDTLGAGRTNDIDHRVTLLRVIGRGHRVLGFIKQDIDLAFPTNGLIMEAYVIRRKHLHAQTIRHLTIDRDHTGLDKIIGLTTGTYTGIGQVFIQTNRLRRIFVLLTIVLLFTFGIESVVAFRFVKRTTRTALAVLMKARTLLVAFALETRTGLVFAITLKTRTGLLSVSVKTRTRPAFSFIVGMIVKHVL